MLRAMVFVFVLALGLAALGADVTVVVNGKTVTVPAIEQDGNAFIDVVALLKALGGTATYDPAAHKVVGSLPGQEWLGTSQLPGEDGVLGTLYTMRTGSPLYFNLLRAEYTTSQVVIGQRLFTPKEDQKLLVLHFTVQNPQKNDLNVRHDSLRFMVVDAMNVNHDYVRAWGDEENRQDLNMMLKPAQKVAGYTVIEVPARGVIPKLMVTSGMDNDGPVLRYDLREKVEKLPAPIADPADPSGATALTSVPAQVGTAYPYQAFDITIEKFAYTTDPLNERAPEKDGRYLVVTALLKNKAPTDQNCRLDMVKPTLTGEDGEILRYQGMLLATVDRPIAQMLKPDQEMRVRMYFSVTKGSTARALALKQQLSREYVFEVTE